MHINKFTSNGTALVLNLAAVAQSAQPDCHYRRLQLLGQRCIVLVVLGLITADTTIGFSWLQPALFVGFTLKAHQAFGIWTACNVLQASVHGEAALLTACTSCSRSCNRRRARQAVNADYTGTSTHAVMFRKDKRIFELSKSRPANPCWSV